VADAQLPWLLVFDWVDGVAAWADAAVVEVVAVDFEAAVEAAVDGVVVGVVDVLCWPAMQPVSATTPSTLAAPATRRARWAG
jgi:hypothetical protein